VEGFLYIVLIGFAAVGALAFVDWGPPRLSVETSLLYVACWLHAVVGFTVLWLPVLGLLLMPHPVGPGWALYAAMSILVCISFALGFLTAASIVVLLTKLRNALTT
jgi:hypothetical protein